MKLELDTLKYAKLLYYKGLKSNDAEAFMSAFSEFELQNLYSKIEIDTMLNKSIQELFAEQARKTKASEEALRRQLREQRIEREKALRQQRREFDQRMLLAEKRIEEEKAEFRAQFRWGIGIIISSVLALAGYLSALIHFALYHA